MLCTLFLAASKEFLNERLKRELVRWHFRNCHAHSGDRSFPFTIESVCNYAARVLTPQIQKIGKIQKSRSHTFFWLFRTFYRCSYLVRGNGPTQIKKEASRKARLEFSRDSICELENAANTELKLSRILQQLTHLRIKIA